MTDTPERQPSPPVVHPDEPVHRLVRPRTVRGLRIGGGAILAGLVLADLAIHRYPKFGLDATVGFYAWYGFGACVAVVLAAAGLGKWLKRPDTYYEAGRNDGDGPVA